METPDLLRLGLLILCLALSGLFSSSETALISLSKVRLMHLVNTGYPGARRVARLIEKPEKLLATVLFSNNLVNTTAAALGTALALNMLGDGNMAILVATVTVTTLLLIFGETLPKTIAWNRAEFVAFAVARPIRFFQLIFSPAIYALIGISFLATRLLGIRGNSASRVSEEEIRTLIAVSAQSGEVAETEAALLEKIFHFGDRQLREIMTPRIEIVWIELGTTLEKFLQIYAGHSHTRFPVYDGTTEDVVGVLAVKDVLMAQAKGQLTPADSVTDLLRSAYFAPETKTIASAFQEMQAGSYGMTLVVDEFGGIAGLATLTQLLEVIVGDVWEEGEEPDKGFTPIDDTTYWVDAGVNIRDINEELNLGIPEGEYQTVAGFILDTLGHIPQEGDHVEYRDLALTVRVMNGVRIEEVELSKAKQAHPIIDNS